MRNLLFIVLSLVSFTLFSQERENREDIQFTSISPTLKKVIGWSFEQISGKWESEKGKFKYNRKSYPDNGYCGYKKGYKSQTQKLETIHTRKISINDSTYYSIIYTETNYGYKYPTLKEGYYSFKSYEVYIFTENEFRKLDSISDSTQIETKYHFSIRKKGCTDLELSNHIQSTLNDKPSFIPYKFTFGKVKENIRLTLPGKESLEKGYFEIDSLSFKSIII